MIRFRNLFLLLLSFSFLLSSCWDDDDPEPSTPAGLTAHAGPDQQVQVGQIVVLDGRASKDGQNGSFTYAWSLTKKPATSTTTLAGATTAQPSFSIDQAGEYEAELTISNAAGTHSDKVLVVATAAGGSGGPSPETPFTEIPDEMVGTWFADDNEGPLTVNWEQETFQGQQGFKDFRTMIFTKNGKNATEYTTEVVNVGDEVKRYFYKITGTLEYKTSPRSLRFHPQSGTMRVFSNKYSGYRESPITQSSLQSYFSLLLDPQATTFATATNYLNAKRSDGGNQHSVKYRKVGGGSTTPGGGTPGGLYSAPPASGTYVQIANLYYPTVTIGRQEWMAVNYAGPGGMKNDDKPHYGTYFKFADLPNIPIPAGWRLPTKQDYIKLIQSQGIAFDMDLESTDGDHVPSKRLLGQLMATTDWLKQDGYANNRSGFGAVPANLLVLNGNPHGEGSNCLLWTSERNAQDDPVAFKLIQFPSDTYAGFGSYPVSFWPPHLPVRLVRDK